MQKENKILYQKAEEELEVLKSIEGHRYGKITSVDENEGTLWVDYENSQLKRSVLAVLANPFHTLAHLKEACIEGYLVKLEFIGNDPKQPVVKEIYMPLGAQIKIQEQADQQTVLHIKADKLILEGRDEVLIKSEETKAQYLGKKNRITEEADDIRSNAWVKNRITGGSVLIN
ncbi:MAG: hypothetical protein GY786_04140 [Proteobacteria bacterium]|nr:hypothetical protein [Pseudomonadota bacterium]